MVDDDAEQPRRRGGGGHRFRVGSRVEVLTDEDLGGVYFTATVIQSKLSRSRRRSKPPEQLCVEYHTLNSSVDRRKEYVDVSSVRPPPPSLAVNNRFHANEVIEALYNGGWWKGVVSRAVGDGNGERFKVIFDKSVGEFPIEFRRSAIRAHWDWVDGVWAGLPDLDKVEFCVGKQVEVSIEGNNAWFPAVVARGLENGGFLLEFTDKSGIVRDEVDSANVRPSPPILKGKRFGKSERVEAFFDFRWWSGVITQTRVKNRKSVCNVFFEEMNLNKVIDVSELRASMNWKDGKWFLPYSSTSSSKIASSLMKRRSDSESRALKEHKGDHLDPEPRSSNNSSVLIDEGSVTPHIAIGNPLTVIDGNSLEPEPESSDNSSVLIDEGSVAPDSGWSFVKRSIHWKDIESMEVFRKMPQKPHFQPLRLLKEPEQQGMAISYMVTFSNVVERCCSLKFHDPKCVGEDLNSTLLKLETHGFDLAMVRDCVTKFLEAKDEVEKLVHEGKGIKNHMEEHLYKKSKYDRDIEVMNGHIRRLQEQIELALIGKTNEDRQISHLETKLDQILQRISGVKSDFKALTASLS